MGAPYEWPAHFMPGAPLTEAEREAIKAAREARALRLEWERDNAIGCAWGELPGFAVALDGAIEGHRHEVAICPEQAAIVLLAAARWVLLAACPEGTDETDDIGGVIRALDVAVTEEGEE